MVMRPSTFDEFLAQQQSQDLLRFITCGSVDDGKSTLIGRLLWESQQLFDDQIEALKTESRKYGTQGDEIDFALAMDGLAAEREQGITIDVAYRFFATNKRKFIVADTPGHEQYTRNMVTGASTASAAVLLVDARHGLLTQTRRHAYLVSLMGIRHVVLAVNKMDLIGFAAADFHRIQQSFQQFAQTLGFESVTAIPLSALKGDNITQASTNTPWYAGPTLMGFLESVKLNPPGSDPFVFPVQWINRPDSSFRGLSGGVAQGSVKVGDEIRVTSSGQTATVAEIVTLDGLLTEAVAGDAVTLRLSQEIDASRGDVLSLGQRPLETTDQFEATLVWMNEEAGLIGRSYDIKLATQWAAASVTSIKHRVDINTLAHEASKHLALNDISVCNFATSKPLVFDSYQNSRTLGSFILVDRFSHATVAAGMIRHSLRRAHNVHKQALSVTRAARERLNGHPGRVIWFTGLSGSGKSTIANALEIELHAQGLRTYVLDGDNVRQGLNKDLGFTDADRVENIRRIAEVAKLMMDAGLIVMTAFISPFRREREMARELIGSENFLEVYVSTPLDVCEQRDVKGLYKKARSGLLPNLTGLNSPYEAPEHPDLELNCSILPTGLVVKKMLDAILASAHRPSDA
ncbi:sulfate adenylyltransferase subunit CysN [Rhodoferax sp. UBA5149]|uniref:sulfate adenylyltransferase subunit CysN n=1 Tax=Rhodoferax sp. UBA5149 TaxID=1947379 RepID=UPI0039C9A558